MSRLCCYDSESHLQQNRGFTLVELMVSVTLSLLLLLIASGLIFSTKSVFLTNADYADTQETARFALDNIGRSLRQAGFVNLDFNNAPQITPSIASADVGGLDANSLSAASSDLSSPLGVSVNSSDVLAVRFFGSGTSSGGDGSITNCAGFSVPAPSSAETVDEDRGWSIYYVSNDINKEPELFCKYQSVNSKGGSISWNAQAVVKGVESFQVLYGIDTNEPANGSASKFLNATAINALDAGLVLSGATEAEKKADLNRKTFWKKVTEIKIALLISGSESARVDSATNTYNLFGDDYASLSASTDKGTTIREKDLTPDRRKRLRRIYTMSVVLRNRCDVDPVRGTCQAPN
ncbi:PilW family protein [Undibacterium jejuense]|uniref:PilW family protein n=1 Tax=Undibacterium jejuense TaxID=1344949 RepID=UPI00248444B7|nr:PilW family protein [Undibacterium jejuense]